MREHFVFDHPDVRRIVRDYVMGRGDVLEDLGNFVIRKVGRVSRLEHVMQEIVDWWDEEVNPSLLKELLWGRRYYRVVFKNLLEFSNFGETLKSTGTGWQTSWGRVYYVPLGDYGDEVELRRSFSKNVWKNVRNSKNRIRRKYGEVSVVEGDPHSLYGWTVERIRERHPNGPFEDPDHVSTVKDILDVLAEEGRLKVWVLRGGGEVLATNYVIESGEVALSYLAGYDPSGDFYRLLIYSVILEYYGRGFREFNFMKGESPYKRQWTDRYYKLYRYEALNPNPINRLTGLFRVLL